MLDINGLTVTQNDIRHRDRLDGMRLYVQAGGVWTQQELARYAVEHRLPKVSPLIQLSVFEGDDSIFIHDGHHRILSTFLAGRVFLHDGEYVLTKWKFEQYLEVNHANGWYTPYDPRIQVRTADFNAFKAEARRRFLNNEADAEAWIFANVDQFRVERESLRTVEDLAEQMGLLV